METTHSMMASIIVLVEQVNIVIDQRNLWTFAAMVALFLRGKRAHLYELGKALPGKGKLESRVQKLRRWLSNPRICPEQFLPVYLHVLAPLLVSLPQLVLIIDRTEWKRLGVHVNLFICSVAFKGRSFPIYWIVLPKRGCSSLADQKVLLEPVFQALQAHPLLAPTRKVILADREFCAPRLAQWIRRFEIHFCLRVKKSFYVSRTDIPPRRISTFLQHCQPGTCYFFEAISLTTTTRMPCHLFLSWRKDCQEPLALITDLQEPESLEALYGERMFIETLNRDLKSGGYDVERGKLTEAKRLTNLLIPLALAYLCTVIQGNLEEIKAPPPPLRKRRLSLFTKARNLFNDLFERKPLRVVLQFFQEFFAFLLTLMTQTTLRNTTILLRKFSKRQLTLLQ
jgi:hypothetical protein